MNDNQTKKPKERLLLVRLPRNVEKAMGVSLAEGPFIYVEEEFLDQMAAKRPKAYLRDLEEIALAIKEPDFAGFDEEEECCCFVRSYFLRGDFYLYLIKVGRYGNPVRWTLLGLSCLGKLSYENKATSFLRLEKH